MPVHALFQQIATRAAAAEVARLRPKSVLHDLQPTAFRGRQAITEPTSLQNVDPVAWRAIPSDVARRIAIAPKPTPSKLSAADQKRQAEHEARINNSEYQRGLRQAVSESPYTVLYPDPPKPEPKPVAPIPPIRIGAAPIPKVIATQPTGYMIPVQPLAAQYAALTPEGYGGAASAAAFWGGR